MPKAYDIAILGATAAGYVAAITLAKKGRQVVVLAAPGSRTESPLADWLPADVVKACPALRLAKAAGTDAPFKQFWVHSDAFDRQAVCRFRSPAGFVFRSAQLLKTLAAKADRAGVDRARFKDPPEIAPHEREVSVRARAAGTGSARRAPREFRASILLIAQGRPADVVARLSLPVRHPPRGRLTVSGLDVPLTAAGARRKLGPGLHIVASGRGDGMGMFFLVRGCVHLRVIWSDPSGVNGADELAHLVSRLQAASLLPAKLRLSSASAAMWRPPGGVALDLETHLAKRTLMIGTAGGFASAMTGQTVDPSVRSALAAADVAHRALRSPRPQDILAEYKNHWRDELADRIRPPGSSMGMLMPMVLSNQAMTRRFARAFLYGENI